MRSTISPAQSTETVTETAGAPAIELPEGLPAEGVTLGRQPNNDGDNSGAMWFE